MPSLFGVGPDSIPNDDEEALLGGLLFRRNEGFSLFN